MGPSKLSSGVRRSGKLLCVRKSLNTWIINIFFYELAEIISFDKFNIVFKKVSDASCFVIGDYEENELVIFF